VTKQQEGIRAQVIATFYDQQTRKNQRP
jgi:hypothetical protein